VRVGGSGVEPRARSEEQLLQDEAERELTYWGWLWFHDTDSRKNPTGLPDLVAVHPRCGRLMFLELKSSTGKLSVGHMAGRTVLRWMWGQVDWMRALKLASSLSDGRIIARVMRPKDLPMIRALAECCGQRPAFQPIYIPEPWMDDDMPQG